MRAAALRLCGSILFIGVACAHAQSRLEGAAFEARSHFYLGEYGPALAKAAEAHRLLEQDAVAKRTGAALVVLGTRGAIHVSLGQPREAKRALEEGKALVPAILAASRSNPASFKASSFQAAQLLKSLAIAELLLGNNAAAKQAVAQAWSVARGSGFDGLGEFLDLPRLEAQAAITGAPRSAEAQRRARELVSGSGSPIGQTMQKLFEELIAISPAQTEELLPTLLPVLALEDRIEVHVRLARAYELERKDDGALRQYAAAIALIEDARVQSVESAALPSFFSRFVDIYASAVEAAYRRAQTGGTSYAELALRYSEAAHARQFAEKYGGSLMDAFGLASSVPDSVRARERQLRQALGAASAQGLLSIVAAPVAARQGSEAAARAYREFIDGARRQYPRYGAIAFPRPIAAGELPAALDGKYVVSYMVTDSAVYSWLIFNRRIVAFDRSAISRDDLRTQVRKFVPKLVDEDFAALCDALVRKPFGRIAGMAAAAAPPRVVVVPDDVLYAVPWDGLCGLAGGSLGEKFILSHAPSLTVLAQAVETPRPSERKSAFLVGDTLAQATPIPGLVPLPPLSRAPFDQAVAALRTTGYQATTLEKGDATREAVLARDLMPYSLIHFDTHAFAELIEPQPSLLLRPSARSPLGLLTLADIPQMKLRARLVALSACQTALGSERDPLPGEGVEALARVFMIAGAKAVLATLWVVEENSSGFLVETFYKELPGAPDMATALFRAKAATRARFPSRHRWAAFVLIGDPGS